MPNRPMPFHSLLKSVVVGGCVLLAGCDLFGDPPTQLEAQIKTARDIRDKDALLKNVVDYLAVKGLSQTQFRLVALDEKAHTYSLRVVGKEAVPAALLQQLANGLATAERERTWSAKLLVGAPAELDQFLKTKKREFPLVLGWKSAQIEAYVVRQPVSPIDQLLRMQGGRVGQEKKTALCMLSFKPDVAIPKLEGTYAEVYGKERQMTMAELRAAAGADLLYQAPYELTFEQAALAEAFDQPLAKDGKIMFQFAVIEDARVTEIGDGIVALDHQGNTQKQCQGKLEEQKPAIHQHIAKAALLAQVEAIGAARLVPPGVAGK